MSRSHTRRAHLDKKRTTRRFKSKGWLPKERGDDGSLHDAQRRERRRDHGAHG